MIFLCNFDCPETHDIDQADLRLTEIDLPLPPKCWDVPRCMPQCPTGFVVFLKYYYKICSLTVRHTHTHTPYFSLFYLPSTHTPDLFLTLLPFVLFGDSDIVYVYDFKLVFYVYMRVHMSACACAGSGAQRSGVGSSGVKGSHNVPSMGAGN